MSDKERLTAIIAFRTYPSFKRELMEEAKAKGKSLSDYFYEIFELGYEQINKGSVKQGSEKEPVKTEDC